MKPAILIDKSRDMLSASATPVPSPLDSPIGTTSSISTMPLNSPTSPIIPAYTSSQALLVTQDIVLSKKSPAVEFLKFPKLPLEVRRLVFHEAMPRPGAFTIQRFDDLDSVHDCQLSESDYSATSCSKMGEYSTLEHWWLSNITIFDSDISFYCDEYPDETRKHREATLRSVCKESLVEFDLIFPHSLIALPDTCAADSTPDPFRLYFNKDDIMYLHCLSTASRMCGFTDMMASHSWTKSIEILHVPFECFKRGEVNRWEELARGLLGVMKAFPALKELRTANRDTWEEYAYEVRNWSTEPINDDEDDDDDDSDDDSEEESDEDDDERSGGADEEFEKFRPKLLKKIIEALEGTDCVKNGEVRIPVIKVYMGRSGEIWNSVQYIRSRKPMISD
ncbi:hypothetical protein IFR05_015253 [Cadophora sp. M221]|nr:hypothetical protein IFR05_015253 [Cadophora sp. M221]